MSLVRKLLTLIVPAYAALSAEPGGTVWAKEITRTCNGYYRASVHMIDGRKVPGISVRLEEFFARGTCGSAVRNRCRERARDKIERCAKAHWQDRWNYAFGGSKEGQIPPECTQAVSVHNYELSNIKHTLENAICCHNDAKSYGDVSIALAEVSHGEKACGAGRSGFNPKLGGVVLEGAYRVNCKAFRRKFGCARNFENGSDRPGQVRDNIRNFDLSSPLPQLCHAACVGDKNCRAWVYVRPGMQGKGKNARCWLKNTKPKRVKASCCISGVMTGRKAASGKPSESGKRGKGAARSARKCQSRLAPEACHDKKGAAVKAARQKFKQFRRNKFQGQSVERRVEVCERKARRGGKKWCCRIRARLCRS